MNARIFIAGLLALFCFASCSYQDVDITDIRKFRVNSMGSDRLYFSFDVHIDNPNSYPLKVSSSDLEMEINRVNFGKLYLEESVQVPKKFKGYVNVQSSVSTEKAGSNLISVLVGSLLTQSLDVRLHGKVRGGSGLFTKNFDVDHREKVAFDGNIRPR